MTRTTVLAATAAAVAVAAFAMPSIARADIPTPLAFDSMTPADGATLVQGSTPTFEVSSSGRYSLWAEVATQPTLGQDGTLASDFTVDTVPLFESDAYPNQYEGTGRTGLADWSRRPGVYYFQVYSTTTTFDPTTLQFSRPVGPVRRIVVAAPPVHLTAAEGAPVVRDALRTKFASRFPGPRKTKVTTRRLSRSTISYRVSWITGGVRYSGTVTVRESAENYTYWVNVARR